MDNGAVSFPSSYIETIEILREALVCPYNSYGPTSSRPLFHHTFGGYFVVKYRNFNVLQFNFVILLSIYR